MFGEIKGVSAHILTKKRKQGFGQNLALETGFFRKDFRRHQKNQLRENSTGDGGGELHRDVRNGTQLEKKRLKKVAPVFTQWEGGKADWEWGEGGSHGKAVLKKNF